MEPNALFTIEDILGILPHRPPFLFVNRVMALDPFKSIVAERDLRMDEPQFSGHFPGLPIMPGVLVAEALAQASGLLLGLSEKSGAAHEPPEKPRYFLASTNFKFMQPARPGDLLVLRASADGEFSGLFRFRAEARVGEAVIASGNLTLARQKE